MFNRVFLFLATNLAVLALVSIVMSVLGVNPNQFGGLPIMAALFGFGGSIVSLLLSKWMAKRSTGAHVIEQPRNEAEQWLLSTVRRQAEAAGIGMPEVAIYDAPEINAFATGANRNNALVAVSTGLLRAMSRDEAEAVLAHEVSHVANGDMVTMALLQGVLNTFVIVLARVVGGVVDSFLSGNREGEGRGFGYYIIVMVLEVVFGLTSQPTARRFTGNLLLAFLPAVVLGVLFADLIHHYLFNPSTVATALVVGGVIMLWAERRTHRVAVDHDDDMRWSHAL